jgi:hypothetical protein
VDETGALLATFNSSNPAPLNKNLVYGSKIFVKFTATNPAVRFLANWVCANGKWTLNILFVSFANIFEICMFSLYIYLYKVT